MTPQVAREIDRLDEEVAALDRIWREAFRAERAAWRDLRDAKRERDAARRDEAEERREFGRAWGLGRDD